MRDTIIGILAVGFISFGWIHLKKTGLELLPKTQPKSQIEALTTTIPPQTLRNQLVKNVSKKVSKTTKKQGDKHEKHQDRRSHQQVRRIGEGEVAQSETAKAEAIPSIYQGSEELVNSTGERRLVPVQAYLASKRHALPSAAPVDSAGMRLFIQCLEIKKSETRQMTLTEQTESECRELAIRSHSVRSNY